MERLDPKFHPGDRVRFIGIQPGEEPYFLDDMKKIVQNHPILTIDCYLSFNQIYRKNCYAVQETARYGWLEDWFIPADLPAVDPSEFLSLLRSEGREAP